MTVSLLDLARQAVCATHEIVIGRLPYELTNYDELRVQDACTEGHAKPTAPDGQPTIPDRSVWRSQLATWPDDDRQRWGERSNALEDQGKPWNVAEWEAFQEISIDRHRRTIQ